MDAAAGDDQDVAVLPNEEIVVHQLAVPGLGDDHRNMHALILRAGFDDNIYSGLVRLGDDIDVRRGAPAGTLAVIPDVIGPLRDLMQACDLPQQIQFHGAELLRHISLPFLGDYSPF